MSPGHPQGEIEAGAPLSEGHRAQGCHHTTAVPSPGHQPHSEQSHGGEFGLPGRGTDPKTSRDAAKASALHSPAWSRIPILEEISW